MMEPELHAERIADAFLATYHRLAPLYAIVPPASAPVLQRILVIAVFQRLLDLGSIA